MVDINTHNMVCDFGRHKGELWTRVPVSYLKWMVNERHPQAEIASAELKRRGTTTPTLDLSGHAIDRASTACWTIYRRTRAADEEGIHSWLARVAAAARQAGNIDKKCRYHYLGMIFCFDEDGVWPVLKTVMKE